VVWWFFAMASMMRGFQLSSVAARWTHTDEETTETAAQDRAHLDPQRSPLPHAELRRRADGDHDRDRGEQARDDREQDR
jgi:hypothetical protein